MTCPKCNKEVNPDWLCCPFHEELVMLKEKCPECGEMEWIGRKICVTKVISARNKLFDYTRDPHPNKHENAILLIGIAIIIIAFIALLFSVILPEFGDIGIGIFLILMFITMVITMVIMFIGSPLASKRDRRIKQQKESEFLQKFPEHAEILEKAKGEK